jgi:hypothetical protein
MNPCPKQGFSFLERVMKADAVRTDAVRTDLEKFIAIVSHCSERDKVLEAIRYLRRTKDYKCPTASVFALHLILELYSEDSSGEANMNRITTNLEAAADELNHLSKVIRERA